MAKRQKVTSKQVAELAGVSQTTVSFVLNRVVSANISEETQQRVWDAARELGYVPDVSARALARGRSANIGLVLSNPHPQVFLDEYVPNIITGLSRVARARGYRILVELLEDSAQPTAYTDLVRGKEVAGVVVNAPGWTEADAAKLAGVVHDGFPVVTLDNIHPSVASVVVNKLRGTERIVDHLVGLGHQRVACISYAPLAENPHAYARFSVYRERLAAAGIAFDQSLVREGAFDPDTGYIAMRSLLALRPPPTALYAMNDVMAFGAMTAIREAGLRVPEDIAVVGFDDIRLAAFTTPPLTTVREPDIEHGRLAGEMLIQLIEGQPLDTLHVELDTDLIIRESCGYGQRVVSQPT
jgi:LacI family transcriptional regulator